MTAAIFGRVDLTHLVTLAVGYTLGRFAHWRAKR